MKAVIIGVASLAWLSTCLVTASASRATDYLHLFDKQHLASSHITTQIISTIQHLDVQQNELAISLMERIKSLAKDNQVDPDVKSVCERLAQLADQTDVCSDELIELTKHIVAMDEQQVGPAAELGPLMRHFGGLKFDACVNRHQGYFHLLLGLFVEESLDDVLAAALGMSESEFKKLDDLEKYKKLKSLDMMKDKKLKVSRMAKRAAGYEPKTDDNLSLVLNFFHTKCSYLQQMLGSVLDILALARVFGVDELAYRKRLLKMGEQRRLCLAIEGEATRPEVESNLARRLADSKSSRLAQSSKLAILSNWNKLRSAKISKRASDKGQTQS